MPCMYFLCSLYANDKGHTSGISGICMAGISLYAWHVHFKLAVSYGHLDCQENSTALKASLRICLLRVVWPSGVATAIGVTAASAWEMRTSGFCCPSDRCQSNTNGSAAATNVRVTMAFRCGNSNWSKDSACLGHLIFSLPVLTPAMLNQTSASGILARS